MTLVTDELLARLAPISLDELVAQAGRQSRVDRKYLVPIGRIPQLLDRIATSGEPAQVLEIDGLREFRYGSVYFDTDSLTCYRMAGHRRRRRAKVRVRTYLDTGSSWLEVKTRGPRGTTVKERIGHEGADDQLGVAGADFVDDRLAEALVPDLSSAALRPVLGTAYRRVTLALGPDRVTIDSHLRWDDREAGGSGGTLERPLLAIVETKAGATPTSVDRALWRLGHRPTRISKFATGLAALRPELPELRWHRTLTTHFRTPTTEKDPS